MPKFSSTILYLNGDLNQCVILASSVPMLHYQTATVKAPKQTQPKLASHQSEASMRNFLVSLDNELDTSRAVSADDLNTALLDAEEVKHMWQARKHMLAVVPARMSKHIRLHQSGGQQSRDETSISMSVRDDRMRGITRRGSISPATSDLQNISQARQGAKSRTIRRYS